MNKNTFFELVTKVLSGEATREERKLFDSYMLSDEYRNLYSWLKKEWYKEIKHPAKNFDYDRGLDKLRSKIGSAAQTQTRAPVVKMPAKKMFFYAAASIALLLAFGFLGKTMLFREDTRKQVHFLSYQTQKGEKKIIELPDGSKVHLNAATRVHYPAEFSGNERNIALTGEAFFLVAEDEKRPFTVHSGDLVTTVLGTSFNVSAFAENDTRITVVSGKVKVANQSGNAAMVLTKGEQAVYDKKAGNLSKTTVNVAPYTGWLSGTLHFEGITLGKAIARMERWYNINIECSSSSLLERNIRGVYEKEPLETVLEDLQFMLDLKYELVNDSLVVITP